MKVQQKRWLILLCVAPLASSTLPAAAYPPDNAAVLYYKAFMLYEEEPEIATLRDDYWHGQIELNEKLEAYFAKNREVIDTVLDATRIDRCDWGMDYSRGTEVLLPPHHQARRIFFLIAGEATMQFDKGHPRVALERCVAMYRMARHINERPLICYLVGVAINAATHGRVTRFLSLMPPDVETLTWLQSELAKLDEQAFSIEPVLVWKREAAILSMAGEGIVKTVEASLDDGECKTKVLERVRTAGPSFVVDNVAYWDRFMDDVQAAFAMPYPKAYAELGRLDEKVCKDFETNPDATLAVCFAPAFQKIYSLAIRLRSQSNALRAALEIYLTAARTGQMPEVLPAGLPVDPFSGEPFEYERTATSFVLRCRGEDLNRNETYKYEHGLAK